MSQKKPSEISTSDPTVQLTLPNGGLHGLTQDEHPYRSPHFDEVFDQHLMGFRPKTDVFLQFFFGTGTPQEGDVGDTTNPNFPP